MANLKNPTGVHDDPFTFMVDELGPSGRLIEHKGGANHIVAAKAAYLVYAEEYAKSTIVLRQRGRIIECSKTS